MRNAWMFRGGGRVDSTHRASAAADSNAGWRDAMLDEIRARLINVELKTDGVIDRLAGPGGGGHPDQAFGGHTYAQFGEDLIILNIFHMLGLTQPSYLDVGAHHPFNISNTALLHARGSRGINVEANPNLIEAFHKHRREDINLNVGIGPRQGRLDFYFIDDWSGRNTFRRDVAEAFVRDHPEFTIQKVQPIRVVTLNDVVTEHAHGRFPDLLSLDVEGMDLDILRATSFGEHGPRVICVECDWSGAPEEARSLTTLLAGQGYVPGFRTLANIMFVRRDAAAVLGMPPSL
jgi:FkbM family methyltransferase